MKTEEISREELKELMSPSNREGMRMVGLTWAAIALIFLGVHFLPHPITVFLALILLGGQQHALAVLSHEAVHRTLFKNRKWNDRFGRICGEPIGFHFDSYRKEHLDHHQFTGTERDPDLAMVSSYPVSKRSLIRKLLRDGSGITGLKRLYGLMLMNAGLLSFSMTKNSKPLTRRSLWKHLLLFFRNAWPCLLSQLLIWGFLFGVLGNGPLYLLWVLAYLTTFSVFIRVRAIAEHACLDGESPLENTRTTLASLLARLTVAPHRVNYHLAHHLWMQVPAFQLPKLHARLVEQGLLGQKTFALSYLDVLREAGSADT